MRSEANSQQTEIDREIKMYFNKQSIADRNFKAEYGLICKADGEWEVRADRGWRVVMSCEAVMRQDLKINY